MTSDNQEHLLELYVYCAEALLERGDSVQAQDLLIAGVFVASELGEARHLARCQHMLARINRTHPAALPDFSLNARLKEQADKLRQKYTLGRMHALRETLERLREQERSRSSRPVVLTPGVQGAQAPAVQGTVAPAPRAPQGGPVPADEAGQTARLSPTVVPRGPIHPWGLALLDEAGRWVKFATIAAEGFELGRTVQPFFAELTGLAPRHARFFVDARGTLHVEDLSQMGGIFQRLRGRAPLTEGQQCRIGSQVLEFHFVEAPAFEGDDDLLWTPTPLTAWAEFWVLRADGKATARLPLLRPEAILGRDASRRAEVLLLGESGASARHARVARTDTGAEIEDLGSTNGTFLRRRGTCPLNPGDELFIGPLLLRVEAPT